MYEKLISQIAQLLRGNMVADEFLPLALQLVAWVRTSKLGYIPVELAFNPNEVPKDAKRLTIFFQKIGESSVLGANSAAFSYVSPALQHLSAGQLIQSLELLAEANLDEPWPADSLIATMNGGLGRWFWGLPTELTNLMATLARIERRARVYLPFEQSLQLTAMAQELGAVTFSETKMAWPFPWLINLLSDTSADIYVGDSLERPGFLDGGRLTQFDLSLAFPPLGGRYNSTLVEHDRFERFPEQTNSIAVLAVRHMLARTLRRVVVAVPNGLFFSPGAERSLREDLLAKRQIEAVIALPPALLAGTALPFSLLVLRIDQPCERIVFVDGCHETLFSKDGKGRATLSGWERIAESVIDQIDSPTSKVVLAGDVLANDAQLQVARYCKTSDTEAVETLLSTFPNRSLGELVSFVRPIPLSQSDGAVSVLEIGPADFPEYGYAVNPGREIKVSELAVAKGAKQFLRPLDIAIAIKGSVGRVAIFPVEMPEAGDARWVVGQSCLVLRVHDVGIIDHRVLFCFLKSQIGQIQLRQIVSGAAVPLIQLRELEKIRIPVPHKAAQAETIEAFEKIVEIEHQVANSRNEQRRLSNSIWSIQEHRSTSPGDESVL